MHSNGFGCRESRVKFQINAVYISVCADSAGNHHAGDIQRHKFAVCTLHCLEKLVCFDRGGGGCRGQAGITRICVLESGDKLIIAD